MPALIFSPPLSPLIICILIKDAVSLFWAVLVPIARVWSYLDRLETDGVPSLFHPPGPVHTARLGFGASRDQIPPSDLPAAAPWAWQQPGVGWNPQKVIFRGGGGGKKRRSSSTFHIQRCWVKPWLVGSALLCFGFSCFSATFSADFLLHCTGLLYF